MKLWYSRSIKLLLLISNLSKFSVSGGNIKESATDQSHVRANSFYVV
jgi:hypothetical protein